MAGTKTKATTVAPADFIAAVPHPVRRADGAALLALFAHVTSEPPRMWGPSIVGFGQYHYRYASGHEGDMARVGFSPRGGHQVLYVGGFAEYDALLARLGKHKTSKACLYVNKLADVDMAVLEEIVRRSWDAAKDVDECAVC